MMVTTLKCSQCKSMQGTIRFGFSTQKVLVGGHCKFRARNLKIKKEDVKTPQGVQMSAQRGEMASSQQLQNVQNDGWQGV